MSPRTEAVTLARLNEDLMEPFGVQNFLQLMIFSVSWTFAITFAAPFYVVYMLDRSGLPLAMVMVLTVVSQVFNVLFLPFWGRIADRFSNTSVLAAAGLILLISILGWTFTTLPERYFLTMPLLWALHITMGLAMGGIVLATGNVGMKLSPLGRAEAYLASLGLVNAGAAFAGPLVAGILAAFFATKELALTFSWSDADMVLAVPTLNLRGLDFLFLITFLLGLYAMHRLALVHEEGAVQERVVFEELKEKLVEDVRSLTSFSTLRQVASFPGYAVARTPLGSRRRGGNGDGDGVNGESGTEP